MWRKSWRISKPDVQTLELRGTDGDKGEQGLRGERGQDGLPGDRGLDGRDGSHGLHGKDGERGPRGPKGEDGERGERGPMPEHQWRRTELRFEKPDGSWGKWVNLKGDPGNNALGGGGGSKFNLDSLGIGNPELIPEQIILKQAGVWKRLDWGDFLNMIGTVEQPSSWVVDGWSSGWVVGDDDGI